MYFGNEIVQGKIEIVKRAGWKCNLTMYTPKYICHGKNHGRDNQLLEGGRGKGLEASASVVVFRLPISPQD